MHHYFNPISRSQVSLRDIFTETARPRNNLLRNVRSVCSLIMFFMSVLQLRGLEVTKAEPEIQRSTIHVQPTGGNLLL